MLRRKKNKESHVIEVMLLLKWDCFQMGFLLFYFIIFFASDLTFLAEHLGNWNNKVAQRGSNSNASHKQDLRLHCSRFQLSEVKRMQTFEKRDYMKY